MQTYKWLDTNLSNQDTPQKCPYDISEVQQHHVFKKQRWKSKLGYEVPQTFSLALCDDVTPGWGGDKYTFTLGTYYISQPIFWENWAKTWSNSQSPTCLLYSHTVWCQSTPGELGRACLWTCEVLQQALSECYGRCSSHGLTHSCWLSPLWCGTGWSERSGEEYQHTKEGRREETIRGWSDSKTGNIEI